LETREFTEGGRPETERPLPPGQVLTRKFPVMTYGEVPEIELADWNFGLEYDAEELARWSWEEIQELPQTELTFDVHCVTRWSRPDTTFKGVLLDDLFEAASIDPPGEYVMAYCHGGYDTNLPLDDVVGGRAMVAFEVDGAPLEEDHGWPARLVVPHLYFWKSAKWIKGLRFLDEDEPGFWETHSYHMRGDPWQEQRHHGD